MTYTVYVVRTSEATFAEKGIEIAEQKKVLKEEKEARMKLGK